jgi:hypothetical protein
MASMILDSETKTVESDHGDELRLWLRLLTCTTLIEGTVRSRLRERFDVTLPRFDLGHLDRRTSDADRRVQVIRLTKVGRAEFRRMAAEHETWIADIFADLTPKEIRELLRLLAKAKGSAQKSSSRRTP